MLRSVVSTYLISYLIMLMVVGLFEISNGGIITANLIIGAIVIYFVTSFLMMTPIFLLVFMLSRLTKFVLNKYKIEV